MIDPEIQAYAEKYSSGESDLLRELRLKTEGEREDRNMLSGYYQGRLLSMLSKMASPMLIVEIGTYMGYSAICLAEGLRESGRLLTIDVNEETNATAREYFEKAGISDRIDARLGNALDVLAELDEPVDLVFIDADKENYSNYYDAVFPLMRTGGLIIADNVLWSGEVLNADSGDEVRPSTAALYEYSRKVSSDPRVSTLLLAVRDGLMVTRKERD